MYVHEHTPHGFPYKHRWRDASLVRLNHLSVNLKSTSQRTFRPEESELAKGRKEEDCFLQSSAVGLKRCLLLQSLLLLPLLAPDSKPPPCWPGARRDGRLHRIENLSRDFPLSDKGSVFLVGRERETDRVEGREIHSECDQEISCQREHLSCMHYHTLPSQAHQCVRVASHLTLYVL